MHMYTLLTHAHTHVRPAHDHPLLTLAHAHPAHTCTSSSSFKQFLELEPQLRDVITQFHQSRYTSCLRILSDMRDTLMLDMYLANHIPALYTMIRSKALIQVGASLGHPLMAQVYPYSTSLMQSPFMRKANQAITKGNSKLCVDCLIHSALTT